MPDLEPKNQQDDTEEIGKQAAALSLIEIGLGSFLHSIKLPLSGHFLSINQIAFLSRSTFKIRLRNASLKISIVSALLKSLSPAGKKLTPMLAIAAQGLFFYLGILFFGMNYIGLFFAVFLSSLWAFIQPVLFIYLLFGQTTSHVIEYYYLQFNKIVPNLQNYLLAIVVFAIVLKFILALIFSLFFMKMSNHDFDLLHTRMILEIKSKKTVEGSAFRMALRDLFNPLFVITFTLTALFFVFSNSISMSQAIWEILRPPAIGFILFYAIRVYPVENLSTKLSSIGFNKLGSALASAIKIVKQNRRL